MVWFGIALVVAVCVGLFAVYDEKDPLLMFVFFPVAAVTGVVAFLFNAFCFMPMNPSEPVDVKYSFDLVQLPGADDEYVDMHYGADTQTTYVMRVKSNSGGYYTKMVTRYADDISIVEDDSETPRVEEWYCVTGDSIWTIITDKSVCQYTLFVPEGSVQD